MAKKKAPTKKAAPKKTAPQKSAGKTATAVKAAKKKAKTATKISHEKQPATKKEAAALARSALREGSRSNTVAAKRGNRKFQPITEPMEKADISRGRQQSTSSDEPKKNPRHKKQPHRRRAALRD